MSVLVTGSAGFIGMHVSEKLLKSGHDVIGIDCLNDYYDVQLKKDRIAQLLSYENFVFYKLDLEDSGSLKKVFKKHKISQIIHLAAQAGVRYSLKNPSVYISANVNGFMNILEVSKENEVSHLVYASSSSVYGGNVLLPFAENQNVDHPLSIYAATKKANELMAHSYSHLYKIPTTGLRFFTAYGPWGRPDMALFIFCKAILEKRPIEIYNHGKMERSFTYIDDVVSAIIKVLEKPPSIETSSKNHLEAGATSSVPYNIFNVGSRKPYSLIEYIATLEQSLGIKAKRKYMNIQPGDVKATQADVSKLESWINYSPNTDIKTGINKFVEWYKGYYT